MNTEIPNVVSAFTPVILQTNKVDSVVFAQRLAMTKRNVSSVKKGAPPMSPADPDVEFKVYAQSVTVEHDDPDLADELSDFLSYDHPGIRYIRSKKISEARINGDQDGLQYWRNWDGKKRLFVDGSFPIGFLWRAAMFLRNRDYEVRVTEKRKKPFVIPEDAVPKFTGVLRPYQEEALQRILRRNHGIIDMGTGSGKTVLALALIAARKHHTFVLVPTVELVNDWLYKARNFLRFPGNNHMVGYASGRQYDMSTINIANIATVHKALTGRTKQPKTLAKYKAIQHEYMNADMLIVDECHHASTKTWIDTIMTSNAYYRYGFTATLDMRHDQADMQYYGLLGERIVKISLSELIRAGDVSPALVKFKRWGNRYVQRPAKWTGVNGVEDQLIVYNHARNQLIANDAWEAWIGHGRRVMVMIRRIDHGELLFDIVKKLHDSSPLASHRPCRIEWVHGKHKDRKQIIQDFRNGKVHILLTQYQLLGEGVDIPDVAAVVMAAGGKSSIKTIQNLGRGIRKSEGKSDLVVHDYADEGMYVTDHAEERLKTYARESAFKIQADDTSLEGLVKYLKEIGAIE